MSRLQQRIENFNNSFKLLQTSVNEYSKNSKNDINRLAITQAFEITCELGWKVLKDYLKTKQIEVFTPKDVIKTAFSINILPTAQIWIDMVQDSNDCSNESYLDKANIIIDKIIKIYYKELQRFTTQIENIKA